MQKRTRSILDELDNMLVQKDRASLIESRASHIIQGAINLMNFIKENYDDETVQELEKRLLLSIKNQDPTRFSRGIKKIK